MGDSKQKKYSIFGASSSDFESGVTGTGDNASKGEGFNFGGSLNFDSSVGKRDDKSGLDALASAADSKPIQLSPKFNFKGVGSGGTSTDGGTGSGGFSFGSSAPSGTSASSAPSGAAGFGFGSSSLASATATAPSATGASPSQVVAQLERKRTWTKVWTRSWARATTRFCHPPSTFPSWA